MRPVQLADIEVAARVLMAVGARQRVGIAAQLIERAALADQVRLATGKAHPLFGSGTLMSAATSLPSSPRPAFLGPDELQAIAIVINGLLANLHHQSS